MASPTTFSAPPSPYISAVVDERHAEFDAFAQRRDFARMRAPVLSHLPRAEPERGNARAVGEGDFRHRCGHRPKDRRKRPAARKMAGCRSTLPHRAVA
jgi:hypothetical protein